MERAALLILLGGFAALLNSQSFAAGIWLCQNSSATEASSAVDSCKIIFDEQYSCTAYREASPYEPSARRTFVEALCGSWKSPKAAYFKGCSDPSEVADNQTGTCATPTPPCEIPAGSKKAASGPTPAPSSWCYSGCGFTGPVGVGIEMDGEYFYQIESTGQECTGSEPGGGASEPATDPPNPNCYTTLENKTICDTDPSDNCGELNGQKVCTGPSGCGYVNGVFVCPEFGNNCGTYNGEFVCVEPEGSPKSDNCMVDSSGRKICLGDTQTTTTTTTSTSNPDGTTTTTSTSTTSTGESNTTTTTTDSAGNETTTEETDKGEESKYSSPDGAEGEGKANDSVNGTGINEFKDGIGSEGDAAGSGMGFGWSMNTGLACAGIGWSFHGESGTWNDWCGYWDSTVRPALGWFFYILTAIGIYHAWLKATRTQ